MECNPKPVRCLPGYGADSVKGTCQLCRVGRFSAGGTLASCLGCPEGFSTTFQGATSGASCTGDELQFCWLVLLHMLHVICVLSLENELECRPYGRQPLLNARQQKGRI